MNCKHCGKPIRKTPSNTWIHVEGAESTCFRGYELATPVTQDGESVPIPEDLRDDYAYAQKYRGHLTSGVWARDAVNLIERIGRAEAERDLWRDAHDEDCPNLTLLDIAREECKEAEAALAAEHTRGWNEAIEAVLKESKRAGIGGLMRLRFQALRKPDTQTETLRWISVEERLPDENAPILYVVETRGVEPYVLKGERTYDGTDWWWCDENGEFDEAGNDGEDSKVTHWMPLPEPPRKPDTQQGEEQPVP